MYLCVCCVRVSVCVCVLLSYAFRVSNTDAFSSFATKLLTIPCANSGSPMGQPLQAMSSLSML